MRTTVTFDPDVYALLRSRVKGKDSKALINEVMRLGFSAYDTQSREAVETFALPVHESPVLMPNIDNVQEVLAELDNAVPVRRGRPRK